MPPFEDITELKSDVCFIKDTIIRLDKAVEQLVDIQKTQARQDERIIHIQTDVEKCIKTHDGVYARIHELEKSADNKTWEILKILAAALIGGFMAAMSKSLWK